MNDTTQHHAYQRGVRMASRWKHLKSTVLKWDRACVSKAQTVNLPKWVGHIPIIAFTVTILAALVFGGVIISMSAVLLASVALIVGKVFSAGGIEVENSDDGAMPSHCFDEDEYVTNSILNDDYDGSPYKSPGGD